MSNSFPKTGRKWCFWILPVGKAPPQKRDEALLEIVMGAMNDSNTIYILAYKEPKTQINKTPHAFVFLSKRNPKVTTPTRQGTPIQMGGC